MKALFPPTALFRLAAFGAVVLGFAVPVSAKAQSFAARDRSVGAAADAAALPYRPMVGEKAIYDVELKGRGVGTSTLELVGRETIDGHETMHASLKVDAGLFLMKYRDKLDSWFDPTRFYSRHFQQDQHALRSSRQKNYLISPEQKTVRETHGNSVDSLMTDEPLDDISMLYFARTLRLRIGDIDTIPRYFKPGHDVIIRVLRRETVTVPAGKFNTIVVQPVITNAGGLFGQGGNAEVYLTDDPQRNVVMIRSSVPVIGSLSLTLRELNPAP